MYKLIRGDLKKRTVKLKRSNLLKQKKMVNTEMMLHKIIFIYSVMRKLQ